MTILVFGVATMAVCGFYVLQDWAALRRAFSAFETIVAQNKDLRAVTVTNAQQMTYRMNCFADGVGFLLGSVITSIGIHGLCLLPIAQATQNPAGNQTHPRS